MFKIGTDVYSTDGHCGKLVKVVLDSDTGKVTHLIVERGFLQKVDRVVPVEAIAQSGPDRIELNMSTEELEASFGEYHEEHFRSEEVGSQPMADVVVDDPAHVLRWGIHYMRPSNPATGPEIDVREGVNPDQPVIGKGTPVYDRDGKAGDVAELRVDEATGEISHLVVNTGIFAQNLVVPMSLVREIGLEGIEIDAHRDELERLS